MKINFRHPKTGKPSTVSIADWWVELFQRSAEIRDDDSTFRTLVECVAFHYYGEGFPDSFPPFATFTQAVEYWIQNYVMIALGQLESQATHRPRADNRRTR